MNQCIIKIIQKKLLLVSVVSGQVEAQFLMRKITT
jgi:hypothetical protein